MYKFKLRYLASVYVDAQSIHYSGDNVAKALAALGDRRFAPVTANESGEGAQPVLRLGFISPQDGKTLILAGERFNFFLQPTVESDGKNMDAVEFSEFGDEAGRKLGALLSCFGRNAHRIALVREGYLPRLSAKRVSNLASRLIQMPPTFTKRFPFEWNWRVASEIDRSFGGKTEPTNTIITVNHGGTRLISTASEKELSVSRTRVDFDVNTAPKNTQARFDATDVGAFFEQAINWHEDLEKEANQFFWGKRK